MIQRFKITNGYIYDIETEKKYNYHDSEFINLINNINSEKLQYKRDLNTLKYKIKKMVE